MFRRWLQDDVQPNNDSTTSNSGNATTSTKVKRKKRFSPTTGPGLTTTTTWDNVYPPPPGYQYAVQEFQQTVPFGSIDDDGSSLLRTIDRETNIYQHQHYDEAAAAGYVPAPDASKRPTRNDGSTPPPAAEDSPPLPSPHNPSVHTRFSEDSQEFQTFPTLYSPSGNYAYPYHSRQPFPVATHNMPDSSYEEWYGDAYLGGPIKYLYPSGYQSMRPRGGPWRLSIVICLLFTWLSVFIIGHCSDRVDQSLYGDDDQVAIQTRWCGSKLLYGMWVMSMLITGLSAAYCSVIGYIKVRDFAVANTRSQPPGLVGKSDYFVVDNGKNADIYQSDGNPQFWGSHIYRPTQAAAAVTSR
jgi:hypothetical protein